MQHWASVRFGELRVETSAGRHTFHVQVYLGDLGAEAVRVELYADPLEGEASRPTEMARGSPITGAVRVKGLLRLPPTEKPAWFLPDNRPDLNYWFWIDLPAMATADRLESVAPFYIDADATPNPGGWPKGAVTRLELRNDHLQYAITWVSLAVVLIVIYFLYHHRHARAG